MKLIVTTICLSTFLFAYSQASYFNSSSNWSRNKKEIVMNAGVSQFLGDLGGGIGSGKDYSLKDINLKSTNFNVGVGFRYRFHRYFATTTMLNFGLLKGDDAFSKDPGRQSRNLSFRSPFLNLAQRFEWIIYANEKVGSRYGMKGGAKDHNFQLYVFGGVGIAYYNPQTKYHGKWTNLRPLKTEGQGLEGGPKNYLPVTATIPAGIGLKFGIAKMWTLGIEATYIKTFSDYIDDVSGVYYDRNVLLQKVGQASADLSDRSTYNAGLKGDIRGQKQKDAVFYLNIIATKNITYKNMSAQLHVRKYKYKRAKF
jgi:hypothetical protein